MSDAEVLANLSEFFCFCWLCYPAVLCVAVTFVLVSVCRTNSERRRSHQEIHKQREDRTRVSEGVGGGEVGGARST